jgi:hypothetical protein
VVLAVFLVVVAHPARAQQTPYRPQPVLQDTLPETGKGPWWDTFRKAANAGDARATGLRYGVVHGCMDAFDVTLVRQSPTFDEYKKRRTALMRSDLTMDQVLAKVDGYFAEPENQNITVCLAVLTVLRPPR